MNTPFSPKKILDLCTWGVAIFLGIYLLSLPNVSSGFIAPSRLIGICILIIGIAQLIRSWLSQPTDGHQTGLNLIHTNSGNFSELVDALPLTQGAPYQKIILFSQALTNIQQGEVIQVMCQFETTNDLGFNVMIASQVILADSATALTGLEITEASGFNISKNMHHGKTVEVGTIQSPEAFPTMYVNVIAYAASTASTPGDVLTVEQDYGRLSVLRFSTEN